MKWETCPSQYSWRWRQGEGSQRLLHENQYDSGKDSNCPVPQSHQETYYPLSVLPWYIQLSCCWHSMWAFPLFSTAPMVRHSRSSAFISAYLVNSPLSHKSSACPLRVLLLCFQPRLAQFPSAPCWPAAPKAFAKSQRLRFPYQISRDLG